MNNSMTNGSPARHRVIPDTQPEMLKATLRNPENRRLLADIGACLDYARYENRWTLDQLAAELKRDARQVRRWIAGEERTQVDVVFSVEALRWPFVVALSKLADAEVDERIRRRKPA